MSPHSKTNTRKTPKSHTAKTVKSTRSEKRNTTIRSMRTKNANMRADHFTQFRITDEQINQFRRLIHKPKDCFINAMQIMGMIDILGGNILRISCAGEHGFTKEQIEKIFMLHTGHYHDFVDMSYMEFVELLETNLSPGYVTLAGYTGHVFIVGRYVDGRIVYIDPQLDTICDLLSTECESLIKGHRQYYLLFNSTEKLTSNQLQSLGFQV